MSLGEDGDRTVVTNIKPYYTPDMLRGARILIVANLKPANFRGVRSNGMVVAADDTGIGGECVRLLEPTCDVPDGTLFDCGLGTLGLRAEMKHVEKVDMRITASRGCPGGCPDRVAVVFDGDRSLPLSDGAGCFMTVGPEVKDGAPAL